jgi:hypothetical protein
MELDEETVDLNLYFGGFPAGAENSSEETDGRVLCNAPLLHRISAHHLVLSDGTQVYPSPPFKTLTFALPAASYWVPELEREEASLLNC